MRSEPSNSAPTNGAAQVPPSPAPPNEVELQAFRAARDPICQSGSDAITILNEAIDAAEGVEAARGVDRVVDRIEEAQTQLDAIPVPGSIKAFVDADTGRRTERLRLMKALADAFRQGDGAGARTIDAKLTSVNVATEAAEDQLQLRHCP
jgi:hypothetical protein